jgi:ABC-type bacteriocin/lantibiotic exporter with double-glycine peptidase domain
VALNLLVHQLLVLALVLLVCLGFAAAIRGLQTFVVEIIQRRLFARVAADMAYRLPRVRVDAYDQQYGPDLVNRFFDVLTVQKVGASLLLDGIAVVLQAVIGLLVLAFYHPFLLGFDLIVLGTISFVIFLLGRGAVRTSIRESLAKYDLVARLENIARAPIAYKFPYGHELAMDQGDALTRGYLAARQAHFRILMRQILFALGFQAIASAALLGLGGWLVIQQELTLGQLVAAELIVAVVIGGFAKLGKHLEGWYDLMAAMDKLGHLIDLRLERNDGEPLGETAYSSTEGASLTLHHLSYAYDGYHHEVLQGLDLEIAPGERVAIIGPSGSGKSTLADLIFGLRAPTHGDIELDGVNIRDLRLNSLREQVSLVKEPEVIEGTILENVWLGRHHIPLTEVRAALEAVGLKQELAHLPAGLHTRLTSQGAPLSLGQLRRLMLARAIVGKPRLLVLDEALDGLDLDSRRRVMNALFDRSAPWTLLVITHDQEVASECDRAVALAEGRADHTIPLANGHSPRLEDWLKELRR